MEYEQPQTEEPSAQELIDDDGYEAMNLFDESLLPSKEDFAEALGF